VWNCCGLGLGVNENKSLPLSLPRPLLAQGCTQSLLGFG
jgi:hypothetical protein